MVFSEVGLLFGKKDENANAKGPDISLPEEGSLALPENFGGHVEDGPAEGALGSRLDPPAEAKVTDFLYAARDTMEVPWSRRLLNFKSQWAIPWECRY